MRCPFTILACCGLLLLGACATPRPPAWHPPTTAELEARPLSLQDCPTLARQSDVRVAAWQARLASAHAELTTARTLPNPTFAASWEDLGVRDAAGASISNSTYGLNYPVFFWWTRGKEVAAARGRQRTEEQGVCADQRQLAIEVGTAYFTLLAAGRKEQATTALLQEARASLTLAEESFKVGSVAGHDVDVARTEVRESEAELFDAQHEALTQRLALAFTLGADRPVAVQVEPTTPTLPVIPAPVVGAPSSATTVTTATRLAIVPEPLVDRALRANPAYAKARAAREAAEAELQLEYRRQVPLSEAQPGAARKNDPEGMGHNFSFEVPIPLFNRNQGGVEKAKAELLAAQAEEEQARREVISGLAEAWDAYVAARTRFEQYSAWITSERARQAEDAQDLFAAGQIGYTELIQARRDWRQAELAAVDAWRDSMTSAWKILCQIGDNDPPTSPITVRAVAAGAR